MLILACILLCAAAHLLFAAFAAACRPRRRPLLEARPEYAARHRATIPMGATR